MRIRKGFEELFRLRSNISNDLSTGEVLKRVWKITFLVWKMVRIWRTGRHTPTKNSQEYPPGLFIWKGTTTETVTASRFYNLKNEDVGTIEDASENLNTRENTSRRICLSKTSENCELEPKFML